MKVSFNTSAIIISILHFLVCILSGVLGWMFQMLVVVGAGSVVVWMLYRQKRSGKAVFFCLLPFYLVYIPSSIYLSSYETYPIWIVGIIGNFATYLMVSRSYSMRFMAFAIIMIQLVGWFIIMPNNFALIFSGKNTEGYRLNDISITDEDGHDVNIKSLKGKVVVLDVWNSACGPCIKKFPDLEKLQEKYLNDTSVRIFSVNIPLNHEKPGEVARITQKYSFGKLYFSNQYEADRFGIEEVPTLLILDKNMAFRYAGDLNMGWNIFVNNTERIIDELKKEL